MPAGFQPVDVVWVCGRYQTTGGDLWYTSPKQVDGWGTGGTPTPLGAVQSIDGEAGDYFAIIGGLPYALGDNQYNVVDQSATVHFGAHKSPPATGADDPGPQICCAASNGGTFNWAGLAGITLPLLQVDGGDKCMWALDSAGACYGWGNPSNGCLGNNNTSNNGIEDASLNPPQATPVRVQGVGGVGNLALAAAYGNVSSGQTHFVGLLSTGHVVACGTDQFGECGDNITLPTSSSGSPSNFPFRATPVNVVGVGGTGTLSSIGKISCGNHHTVALSVDGMHVYCWGYNIFGQCGAPVTTPAFSAPIEVTAGLVSAGATLPIVWINGGGGVVGNDGQSIVIDSAGKLYGWGANANGQLGLGNTTSPQPAPVNIPTTGLTLPIVQAYSGASHMVVLDSAGQVAVCGDNSRGSLGNPFLANPTTSLTIINRGAQATVSPAATILRIWAGNQTTMINGRLSTWVNPFMAVTL